MPPFSRRAANGSSNLRRRNANGAESSPFHPKLIAFQIICLQCFHYFVLSLCLQTNSVFYGTSISMDRIFTDNYVKIWNTAGWPDAIAVMIAAAMGSILLTVVVEKSKKCLDFSLTLFLTHLFLCLMYGGFPTSLEWWVVNITAMIVMVLCGEYLCSRKELDEIPLLQL